MKSPLPIKVQLLNISLNLSRIGEWMARDYDGKNKLINRFYAQTLEYTQALADEELSDRFRPTMDKFRSEVSLLNPATTEARDRLLTSERLLAWSNILQHRSLWL